MWKEEVDVSITGNSTNPTRFQHPVAGTFKKECVDRGRSTVAGRRHGPPSIRNNSVVPPPTA